MLSRWTNYFGAARASRFVVVARPGSLAAVLRRSESTRFSSASDDKVGGFGRDPQRAAASNQTEEQRLRSLLGTLLAPLAEAGAL
jgi:hypothetical protein